MVSNAVVDDFNLLESKCIIVDKSKDNVAVFYVGMEEKGGVIFPDGDKITLKQKARKGQRIALIDIADGEVLIQYGSPFGLSKGLKKGDLITRDVLRDIDVDLESVSDPSPPQMPFSPEIYGDMSFQGFVRENGTVGTRNYFLIMPTSLCASETAAQIAREATDKFDIEMKFPNIDGIVAIPTTEGCGCAANVQIERFLGVLSQYLSHPNVGGALVIDLGCEQTNYSALHSYLGRSGLTGNAEYVDWLTIQEEGGVQKTINQAMEIIRVRLTEVGAMMRVQCPISKLIVGTECGASDAFSGITANPLIGAVVDRVISGGGGAILSEVPEMFGAEHLLMERMRDKNVIDKFRQIILWYKKIAESLGVDMRHNLVPENIAGGLINPCIKSLGAITKGGTGPIEGVLEYGEPINSSGLHIMQGPGNDMESITGMVASGANIICFSTGKGTVTGGALVPVVKVASNTELYSKMSDDMDFNGGRLVEEGALCHDDIVDQLFNKVISVASGESSKSELNGQKQFQVWTAGKLSL
jgi:altronate dehydratase